MDFKDLQYVIAIAENKSISKAAKCLYISQPSLSKYLKNLEKRLGINLFERIGNNYVLTYAGELYIKKAREILIIKKGLDDAFFDVMKNKKGRLVVACSILRSPYLISKTIVPFKELYPDVQIQFIESTKTNHLEKLLYSGEADLAIFNYSEKDDNLNCTEITDEEIVLAISSHHPLSTSGKIKNGYKHPVIDLYKFKNDNFIVNSPEQKSGEIAQRLFDIYNINPNILISTRSISCTASLVAEGAGIAFISDTHLKHMNLKAMPMLFSIDNPISKIKLCAVYRKGSYLPQYLKDYIKIVKNELNS